MSVRDAVLDRRLMVEMRNGRIRMSDWCRVNTPVGAGWEPYCPDFIHMFQATQASIDLDDSSNRIDGLDFDFDWRDPYHRDALSGDPLIGGPLMLGRKFSFSDDAVTT